MQITVAVITYEPDIRKLLATIRSIISQRNVEYEIVISDDGSNHVDMEAITGQIREVVPTSIPLRFILNKENHGTVLNIEGACNASTGEYLKIISPGDLLYNKNTLHDLYVYAQKNKVYDFFFGKAIYYSNGQDGMRFYDLSKPSYPSIYNSKSKIVHILSFMYDQSPVGVAYFYKLSSFKKYIDIIANNVRFTEDYTTSILYLLDGNNINFIDKNIVYYEYGTGISTESAKKWEKIYKKDCDEFYQCAKQYHEHNKFLEFRFGDRKARIFHPIIAVMIVLIRKWCRHKAVHHRSTAEEEKQLKTLLQG